MTSFRAKLRFFLGQILPPFIYSRIKRCYRSVLPNKESLIESEIVRLSKFPPGVCGSTSIFGGKFEFTDARSFLHQYKYLFNGKKCLFAALNTPPCIIDCGANIGVSIMWWKHLYPNAQIIAFEADPKIFAVLERNCADLTGVTLYNAAIWNSNSRMPFEALGGEGGRVIESGDPFDRAKVCEVETIRLRDFLLKNLPNGCDFLKLDIEGAEVVVLDDCRDIVSSAEHIFLEYHSFFHKKQSLGEIFTTLENAGFRIHVHVELPSPSPFFQLLKLNRKDLRVHLFCFKEERLPHIHLLD